jgi:hypothetical protein
MTRDLAERNLKGIMAMLTAKMIETIEHQRLGFVATVDQNGAPRVSPKGTFVVIDQKTLAYGDISSPGSTRRLKMDPRIEVNFVNPLTREGLRARGRATLIGSEAPEFTENLARFSQWGPLATRINTIVKIDLVATSPVRTPAYDDGAQQADLVETWIKKLVG